MTTGATNLYDLAHDFLSAIEDAYTTAGVSLPALRFVTAGEPVAQCESLQVNVDRIFTGVPGLAETPRFVDAGLTQSAVLHVFVFRCLSATPEGEGVQLQWSPSDAAFDADALVILTDMATLHSGLGKARAKGTLRGSCEGLQLGPCEPVQTTGTIGGCQMTIVAELS